MVLWKLYQLAIFYSVDVALLSDKTPGMAAAIIAFGAAYYGTGLATALLIDLPRWIEQRLKKVRASRQLQRIRVHLRD
jgi:hypothetical protein